MGFRYRKSINLGKGFRVNMSKTGPGFSWGMKGLRITRTANGKIRGTASIPGTGISYQKEFGNPMKKRQAKNASEKSGKTSSGTSFSNDLGSMKSNEMADIVAASNKNKTNKIISLVLVILGIALAFIEPYFLALVIIGLIFWLVSRNNETIKIDYDMTDEAKEELEATNHFLAGIMESDDVWLVTEAIDLNEGDQADMKIISRTPIRFYEGNDEVETNAQTFTLDGGSSKIIFLPDAIMIKEGSKINALSFKEIDIKLGKTTFLEDQSPAKDATVLGKTYEHTNKDGSPDKRFKENKEVYLVEYGILTMTNPTGLDTLIVFSDTVLDGK